MFRVGLLFRRAAPVNAFLKDLSKALYSLPDSQRNSIVKNLSKQLQTPSKASRSTVTKRTATRKTKPVGRRPTAKKAVSSSASSGKVKHSPAYQKYLAFKRANWDRYKRLSAVDRHRKVNDLWRAHKAALKGGKGKKKTTTAKSLKKKMTGKKKTLKVAKRSGKKASKK